MGFHKLTNSTVFAASFVDTPLRWKDGVLSEPVVKTRAITVLAYTENTRQTNNENVTFLCALGFCLHVVEQVE